MDHKENIFPKDLQLQDPKKKRSAHGGESPLKKRSAHGGESPDALRQFDKPRQAGGQICVAPLTREEERMVDSALLNDTPIVYDFTGTGKHVVSVELQSLKRIQEHRWLDDVVIEVYIRMPVSYTHLTLPTICSV